jgi:hypothetical protein
LLFNGKGSSRKSRKHGNNRVHLAIENGPSKGNIIASQAEGLVQAMELENPKYMTLAAGISMDGFGISR